MSKFITKDRHLTAYALACGYLECNKGFRLSGRFDIWMVADSGCYHLIGYDNSLSSRLFWDSFDNLKDARKAFHKRLKEYGCERRIPKDDA